MHRILYALALIIGTISQFTAEEASSEMSFTESIDSWFKTNLVDPIGGILFTPIFEIPAIVLLLVIGSVFFTIRFKCINIRFFKHGIDCIRGKYDNPDDKGEVSHFKALTSALSATVGLGNIAGVALAIALGGPGAIFWMWIVAFCGMTMKFVSCTLAQTYRRIDEHGTVLGGPMAYLRDGIAERYPQQKHFGEMLAGMYAVLIILASFGGGNMFQSSTSYAIMTTVFPDAGSDSMRWIVGFIFAIATGAVIIGGIKRIGSITSKMVPAMCLLYVLICGIIIISNITAIPQLLCDIVVQAFNPDAAFGGFIGVMVLGMKRAAFSNEAGLGSAAIAHAAAKTDEPAREGVVAMLGPFIDTLVICTLTALTILITEVNPPPEIAKDLNWAEGAALTATAMNSVSSVFSYALVFIVFVFAYSTLISWSYYGDRAVEFLFGKKGVLPYRIIFVMLAVFGPVLSVSNVLDFSDLMILSLAFPNIIGLFMLNGKIGEITRDYTAKLKSGEMKTYK